MSNACKLEAILLSEKIRLLDMNANIIPCTRLRWRLNISKLTLKYSQTS